MKKSLGLIVLVLFLCGSVNAATVAHWNFEDGTPDTPMNNTGMTGQVGTADISGNGYDMYAWDATFGPMFSALGDTPTGVGLSSRHNGGQDGYVFADGLRNWQPGSWTVELSFKLDVVSGWRTLIGKDGVTPRAGDIAAGLYIQCNGINDAIRFNFVTVSLERIELDSTLFPVPGQWYHLAIVVDGDEIDMYADRLDGNGFQNVGSLTMDSGVDHSLLATGTWTFGRGWFNDNFVDHITGNLDDIRFSDVALTPDQFLHSQYAYNPDPPRNAPNVPSSTTTLSWTNPNDVNLCQVYFGRNVDEPNALSYKTKLTLIATVENPAQNESVTIPESLAEGDVCYWVVDCYRDAAPPDDPDLPGLLWSFSVNDNDTPNVDAGPPVRGAWLGMDGSPPDSVTVALDGSATDDGLPNPPGQLDILWTQVSGPSVTIDPNQTAATSVSLTETGIYEFKLRASDGEFENEDTVTVYVGADACGTSHLMPGTPGYPIFDTNQDCIVNLKDLAEFLLAWLDCTDILNNCQ